VKQTSAIGSGVSSLRMVHRIFIASAALMSLVLIGWGFSAFRARDELTALSVAALGCALFLALAAYSFRLGRSS
jgi:hypothetical protein